MLKTNICVTAWSWYVESTRIAKFFEALYSIRFQLKTSTPTVSWYVLNLVQLVVQQRWKRTQFCQCSGLYSLKLHRFERTKWRRNKSVSDSWNSHAIQASVNDESASAAWTNRHPLVPYLHDTCPNLPSYTANLHKIRFDSEPWKRKLFTREEKPVTGDFLQCYNSTKLF